MSWIDEQFFKCYKVGTEIRLSVKSLNIAINKNQPTHICLPHHKWWHSLCRSFRNARCKKSIHIKSEPCRKKHEVVNPTNDIFMVRNHHSYFTFIYYIKAHTHTHRERLSVALTLKFYTKIIRKYLLFNLFFCQKYPFY